MENNREQAAELKTLRERFTPQVTKALEASRQDGIGHIADYMMAASGVLVDGQQSTETLTEKSARKESLDPERFQRWVEHLHLAATNEANPLHAFAKAAKHRDADMAALRAVNHESYFFKLPADARRIADYTTPGQQPWKVDGEAFGQRPLVPGDVILSDDADNPIARVMTYGAARRDLFWNRIKNSPGNENDSGKLAATSRAGQMLRTPTVTLGVGKLHYLIRGKTLVYAAVDSHLMVEGPLHGRLVQKFDQGPIHDLLWVTHDLSDYSGHRAHVEFGPDGDGELEVLMVVEATDPPKWKPTAGSFRASAATRSPADYAKEFQSAVASASKGLGRAAPVRSPDASTDAALADWLVQNPALFSDAPDAAVTRIANEFLAGQSNIASRVRWESHTAIAWLDGTGVDENILLRGKPAKPGPLAPRSLPVAFASAQPITTTASSGRHELARQLVAPSNPLIARTVVNRVWHHVFGRGMVASVDNFGALGDRPTHPELLDHLAWQFVHEDAWSLKRLIRRLVLTQTFAMSSRSADARAEELDPSNALLHRMPVRRLEGEVIRDALLAVSGRLNPTVGGPPVTVHLTEFLVGRGRPDKSGPLDGDGRRSIYIAQRRNFLPTLMQTFDTPTPFSTIGKRNVTNVPGQSLALMNDPLF